MVSLHEIDGKNNLVLGFSSSAKFFPLGLQNWHLFENCNKYQTNTTTVPLKLTKVMIIILFIILNNWDMDKHKLIIQNLGPVL
jgi:hypothetical protein